MKKFGLILFLLLFPILSFAGDDWYLFEWNVWDGISDFGSSSAVTCGFTQYRIPFGSADGCLTESFVTSTDDVVLQLSGTTASSLFEIQDSTGAFTHRFSADGAIQTNNFYVTVAGRVTAEDGFYSQYQHAAVGAAGYHANNIVYGSSVSQANWGSSFELTTNAQSVASGFRTLYLNMVNARNTNYGFYNNVVGTDDIGNILTGIYSEITNGTGRNSVITGISGIATGGGGNPSSGYGVYGSASGSHTNYAGYFEDGNVYIENNLTTVGISEGKSHVTLDTSATYVLVAVDCLGSFRYNNDADAVDYTLPSAEAGLTICFCDIAGGVITVDPFDGTDTIYLNGVSVGAGDAIDSPGAVGDQICLQAVDDTRWITWGRSGIWVDGGAD